MWIILCAFTNVCLLKLLPFTIQCLLLTTIGEKPYENIVGEGENASSFSEMFCPIKEKLLCFSYIELSVIAFNFVIWHRTKGIKYDTSSYLLVGSASVLMTLTDMAYVKRKKKNICNQNFLLFPQYVQFAQ